MNVHLTLDTEEGIRTAALTLALEAVSKPPRLENYQLNDVVTVAKEFESYILEGMTLAEVKAQQENGEEG